MKKNTGKIKVVFCAGGTGGHIYPAIAVADRLKCGNRLNEIIFFVSGRNVERSVFLEKSFTLKEISSADSNELFSLRAGSAILSLVRGYVVSLFELIKDRPDIMVSMGGYSSIPSVLAGYMLRIPILLHEQNALPGKANRFLLKFAKKIALSFERSADYFPRNKIRITGNPVREEILSAEARQRPDGKFSLLVMGGSQGSAALNKAVVEMLSMIDWQKTNIGRIVHITGQKVSTNNAGMEYTSLPYADRIWELLSSCDLVISRAGATAIAEITVRALPSVLIPYPYAAEKHQDINAWVLEEAGAATVLSQDKLSGRTLLDIINSLLESGEKLEHMSLMSGRLSKPDAAQNLVGLIYETI
ncbi:MAG: undecaprenyldiphospho-muramoylpentapeptide beta-N-acetylglucosaminyltransferase [Candidatus Margulisiibacteriota bacterium]